MITDRHVYPIIWDLINKKEDFVLATIISKDGSAPRGPGSKMVIRNDGSITGTIGGGMLEAKVQDTAIMVFQEKTPCLTKYVLDKNSMHSIDMTCGGNIEVLVDYIDTSDPIYYSIYNEIYNRQKSGASLWLANLLPDLPEELNPRRQFLIRADGSTIGYEHEMPSELLSLVDNIVNYKVVWLGDHRMVVEACGNRCTAYIFGAGHVGQKIASLINGLGFNVVVFDDRPEFANRERFPDADEVYVVNQFSEPFKWIKIDINTYIIIVTRGHVHDREVLEEALLTQAVYIGMMGSRSKRDRIYNALLNNGFTYADLKRVYAPIGIPIGADSAEEIAVSIAAELIKVRSVMMNG